MNNKLKNLLKVLCVSCLALTFVAGFAACDNQEVVLSPGDDPKPPVIVDNPTDPPVTETITVTLNGTTAETNAKSGVTITGSTVYISEAGEYELSGTLTDGNIIVSVDKTERVTLVLNGVDIASSTTAPIYIESADKAYITLKSGSVNTLSDPVTYVYENGETKPNACIYSKDDLVIQGDGSLTVNGNYNNGIGTKNDLEIKGGNITVSAVNNAFKGNYSVEITGGTINILAADDAIKTENADRLDKGYVLIENATLMITASDDGIVAVTSITVKSTATIAFNVGGEKYKCSSGTIYYE